MEWNDDYRASSHGDRTFWWLIQALSPRERAVGVPRQALSAIYIYVHTHMIRIYCTVCTIYRTMQMRMPAYVHRDACVHSLTHTYSYALEGDRTQTEDCIWISDDSFICNRPFEICIVQHSIISFPLQNWCAAADVAMHCNVLHHTVPHTRLAALERKTSRLKMAHRECLHGTYIECRVDWMFTQTGLASHMYVHTQVQNINIYDVYMFKPIQIHAHIHR